MGRKLVDLTGNVYGRLTVESRAENRGWETCWNCICICGKKTVVHGVCLKNGTTKSCGCYNLERKTKHGMYKSSEYGVWDGMKGRCNNPNNKRYKNYGARGIKVCKSWRYSFENFYADMGPRPSDKYSIERIDNNKGYSKENCKWIPNYQQYCNRQNNNKLMGVRLAPSGKYTWQTKKKGKTYQGTCETREEAAKAYDDKCEELHSHRPNNTERTIK